MSDISKTQHSRDGEVNDRNTDEARTFKKTEQNTGRPELTDHNINEDVLKNPNSVRPACSCYFSVLIPMSFRTDL